MKYLFTAILSALSLLSLAQAPATEKAHNIYYYKKGFIEVSTKDSADFIQVITEPDSGEALFGVSEFYKSGDIKFYGKSITIHPVMLQGQTISYYPNKKRKEIAAYNNDKLIGDVHAYYANGKTCFITKYLEKDSLDAKKQKKVYRDTLFDRAYDSTGKATLENGNGYFRRYNDDFKTVAEEGAVKNYKRDGKWQGYNSEYSITYKEEYVNGKLINGTSIDSSGVNYTYTQRIKPVSYAGGIDNFWRYMATTIRYPRESHSAHNEGMAMVVISIDKFGKACGYKLTNHGDKFMDEEALRVISRQKNWIPAQYYGKTYASIFPVPVYFTLHTSDTSTLYGAVVTARILSISIR